jgi:hypothetical protein
MDVPLKRPRISDGKRRVYLNTNFEKAYLLEYFKSDNKITDMKSIMNIPEQVQENQKEEEEEEEKKTQPG